MTPEDLRGRIQAIVDKAVDKAVRVVVAEKQAEIDAIEYRVEQYRQRAATLEAERDQARRVGRVYRYATYGGFMVAGGSAGWTIGRLQGAGIGLAAGGALALLIDVVAQIAGR